MKKANARVEIYSEISQFGVNIAVLSHDGIISVVGCDMRAAHAALQRSGGGGGEGDPKNTGTTVIFDYFDSACHRPQSKRLLRVGVTHCIAELRETGAGTQQRTATFSNWFWVP